MIPTRKVMIQTWVTSMTAVSKADFLIGNSDAGHPSHNLSGGHLIRDG